MNYYEHHIGDYDADTAHLSWVEDMAYTRLIRLYYRKERPIPLDIGEVCRLIRASGKDQRAAVEAVLREFFVRSDDGWRQARCDTEIEAYKRRVEHNRRVGAKGGRPRKTQTQKEPEQNPVGYFREPEQNPPQTPDPRQIHSVPVGTDGDAVKSADQLTKDELWHAGKSLLHADGKGLPLRQCGSFVGKLVKDYGDQIVIDAVRSAVVARPADPVEYLKACCMRAMGQRMPVNRQEALEQRNRNVADEWAAQGQGASYAAE